MLRALPLVLLIGCGPAPLAPEFARDLVALDGGRHFPVWGIDAEASFTRVAWVEDPTAYEEERWHGILPVADEGVFSLIQHGGAGAVGRLDRRGGRDLLER